MTTKPNRIIPILGLTLLALLLTHKGFSQFNNFTVQNLDPKKNVIGLGSRGKASLLTPIYYQILQTNTGIIYLENDVSVIAGNGVKWGEFYTENTDEIEDIALNNNDQLIALIQNDIGIFHQSKVGYRFKSLLNKLSEDNLQEITILNNHVYVEGDKFIYELMDGTLSSIVKNTGSNFLIANASEVLRVSPNEGIFKLDGTVVTTFNHGLEVSRVMAFGNDFIFSGQKGGIYIWRYEDQQQYLLNATIQDVSSLQLIKGQWIAIGTESNGCYIITHEGDILAHFSKANGLPSNAINDIFEDNEGSIWLSTNHGIIRIEYLYPVIQVFDGTQYGIVISVQGFQNKIYIGTTDGFFVGDGLSDDFSIISGTKGYIYDFLVHDEQLYIASGGGVYVMDKSQSITQIGNEPTRAIMLGPAKKNIYAGQKKGIGIYSVKRPFSYSGIISGIEDDIRYLGYDKAENVLVAASVSPLVYHIKLTQELSQIEVLDSVNGIKDNVIVFTDEDQAKYGDEQGMLIYDFEKKLFAYDSTYGPNFIERNQPYRFIKDKEGSAWISTNGLVERYFKTSNGYVQDSTTLQELPSSTYRALYIDNNGGAWMGGDDGLFHMDPLLKKAPPKRFTTVISDIGIKNDSLLSFRGISGAHIEGDLTHELNDFIFKYSAPTFNRNAEVRYSFILDGYDKDWSEWTEETYKEYTNLSPGDYSFKVKAKSLFGDSSIATVSFRILPAWYATIWAWMFYALAITGVGYTMFAFQRRRMMAKLKARLKAKQAEIDKQKEIADKLLQVDRLKDDFLANTSHELRTPLNGIIGISESLMDNDVPPDSKELHENLSLVVASGKRLASLVDGILDYSKLKTKTLDLLTKPVDLSSVANVVVTMSRPLTKGHPVAIENHLPDDLPLVWADDNRMMQILYNLVGNAIKFTEEGSIIISAKEIDGEVEVCVQDTGLGIDSDRIESIFDSFESEDQNINRDYIGTGLGLTITKKLVELHQGKIWVTSVPEKGSAFYFTIPVSQEQVEVVKQTPIILDAHPEDLPAQAHKGKFNIMIVDDEPINQQVLSNILNAKGFGVTLASSGKKALELLEKETPDMVLLDIMMPKMSGYEVCEKIRSKFLMSELPVIFITAKNQITDLVEGFSYGANDYVTKPISKDEFLARVNTHLNLHKLNESYARFVPHEFLKLLKRESILDVELGQQVEKQVTLLFSDIRSYTTISEKMTPKENFEFLNKYLKKVGPAIRANGGFISQYFGDGILALFPSEPEDALKTALDMVHLVHEFNQETSKEGKSPIRVGIGLHAGMSMLGILGDEMRMDAGVVSDSVNIASRMEGLTKFYAASIIMSETTLDLIDEKDDYDRRFLGKVVVKGKSKTTNVIEVFQADEDSARLLKLETKADFEDGLRAYFAKNFTEAAALFKSVIERNAHDAAAAHYLKNAAEFMVTGVPEKWEGVENLDFK